MGGLRKSIVNGVYIMFLLLFCMNCFSCTLLLLTDETMNIEVENTDKLLVVVEAGLFPSIEDSIQLYVTDLKAQGCSVETQMWYGDTAYDLKNSIDRVYRERKIGGAILVGTLPAVWYEQVSFNRREEFPCDLYFMDLDAQWYDEDGDRLFDSHSSINLDIFISRISGSPDEINRYFSKVHAYRNDELVVSKRAYIFKDDDWEDYNRGSSFGLKYIYDSISIIEENDETLRSNYINQLSETGADYIYQWIHAYPPILCVEENDSFEYIFTSDINANNLKGLFYNLFNCSASRFTENNLAMSYLMKTEYGLATIGSTKVGGNYYPKVFHYVLSRNGSWGDAYKAWYNNYGVTDDHWFMGMVILGDPMLTVSKKMVKKLIADPMTVIPPTQHEIGELTEKLTQFIEGYVEGSFADYINANPDFY